MDRTDPVRLMLGLGLGGGGLFEGGRALHAGFFGGFFLLPWPADHEVILCVCWQLERELTYKNEVVTKFDTHDPPPLGTARADRPEVVNDKEIWRVTRAPAYLEFLCHAACKVIEIAGCRVLTCHSSTPPPPPNS